MKLKTTRYTVCSDRLPEQFAGCRIAMLSDLHDTVYGESNDKLFEVINNEQPDIVIIAGDLVTAKAGRDFSPAFNLLTPDCGTDRIYHSVCVLHHIIRSQQ
ncbi:MAG: metallophosphoesterase, partial [Lachnospiraceae bacterium]|nr:metallophosphoesterase [Lachnospiraceae bacterium]